MAFQHLFWKIEDYIDLVRAGCLNPEREVCGSGVVLSLKFEGTTPESECARVDEHASRRRLLQRALSDLSQKERDTLGTLLDETAGIASAAKKLGIPADTLRQRRGRLVEKLRRSLNPEQADGE